MDSYRSVSKQDNKDPENDQQNGEVEEQPTNYNEIHAKALDDIVNVNSLFTIAVFLGISLASRDQLSLDNKRECDADLGVAKRLVVFEVVSFGFFLLSSLVAKSLKVYLNIADICRFAKDNENLIKKGRGFMFLFSVLSSVVGVVFLTLSMADIIQIKLGKLSCGSNHTFAAIISLTLIVLIALLIYLPSMLTAIICCMVLNENFAPPVCASSTTKSAPPDASGSCIEPLLKSEKGYDRTGPGRLCV